MWVWVGRSGGILGDTDVGIASWDNILGIASWDSILGIAFREEHPGIACGE